MVHRFDRQWSRDGSWILRLPQEDILQSLGYHPEQKYENAGGPGIPAIMEQLKTSDRNTEDRLTFLRAQIVFWMMAATDGHAKNFSLFLHPGSRFSMAPLYDVMSLQPIFDAKQLTRRQMKMAMAVGKKRRYRLFDILPRHFLQTAELCGMGESIVQEIFTELLKDSDNAIEKTVAAMPKGFPASITDSIIGGYKARLPQIERFLS